MKSNFIKYLGILSKSKYVLLLNITDKVFSFIIMLIFARMFMPEAYGELITLFTLSMVFITIFDLGIPLYLQREVALNPENASENFSLAFTAGLILFAGYFITAGISVKVIYPEVSFILFGLTAVMFYISSLVNICNRALSGISDFKSQFKAFVIPRLLIVIVFFAGIYYFSFGMNILIITMLAGFALNLAIAMFYIGKSGIQFSIKCFSFRKFKSILTLSIPLGFAVIFNLLYDKIDVLLISKIVGFADTAYYNVGYGIFKASALAFSFLLVPAFTEVASLKNNKAALKLFLKEYSVMILTICLVVAAALFFLSGLLVQFLYTSKFRDSVLVLQILVFAIMAMGMNNLTGIMLNGMGYYKVVMYITLYGLVFNVSLNLIFIPVYGIIAASVLTVLTEYTIFFTEYYYLKKILKT